MKHQKIILSLLPVLLLALLLGGCAAKAPAAPTPEPVPPTPEPLHFAAGDIPPDSTELRLPLAAGELALLDAMPNLLSADLSGSAEEEAVAAWAKAHPQIDVRYTVTLPDGTQLSSSTQEYDMSRASAAECEAAAPKLALLPGLRLLRLGGEDGRLTWANIAALRKLLPETVFQYAFQLYGRDCDLSAETISLFHVPVTDSGRFIDEIIGYMPQLRSVDMDGCGLEPIRLEEINLRHPNTKVIFRVWFGDNYSVRTDVERILASMPSKGGLITLDNYEGLFFCHDVRFLDLGHNDPLTDISFVAQMPKLEVAILSMCYWSDASPLAYCKELEYLEMTDTYCTDLRPLSGLTKLRHLNVAGTGFDQPHDGTERIHLRDITPLYSLTGLERLWIGAYNPVPAEQIEEMQRRAPGCEIDVTVYDDPVGGRWRYVDLADYVYTYVDTYADRYLKLREQFGNYDISVYSFSWNDPAYAEDAAAPVLTATPTPAIETPAPTEPPAAEESVYQDPESTYQEPESTYQEPESTYQEPESTYQEPESTYQEPESTYQEPDPYQDQPTEGFSPEVQGIIDTYLEQTWPSVQEGTGGGADMDLPEAGPQS